MREILFRGKRVDTGQWVISDCFFQCVGEIKLWDNPNRDGWVCVKAETIGQYTGLTDKNGTKMFEGDIIKTYHGNGKVVYSKQYALFGYIMLEKDNTEKEYDYRFTDVVIEDGIEVIGNIYDNPELLEI